MVGSCLARRVAGALCAIRGSRREQQVVAVGALVFEAGAVLAQVCLAQSRAG